MHRPFGNKNEKVRKNKLPVLKDILMESYAAEGKCLARVEGKVVFVENTVPGDRVDVQLTKSKKDWAEGFALAFTAYSSERTEPFCIHFGVCGGCQWQMLPYELQLAYKQKQVSDCMERIGKVPLPELLPIIGADRTIGYRNKLEYTFGTRRYVSKQAFSLLRAKGEDSVALELSKGAAGFHAKGHFDKVVAIDRCHLQEDISNQARNYVVSFALENGLSFYDIKSHEGYLRNLVVRTTTTGETMLNLVVGNKGEEEKLQALLTGILTHCPTVTTLLYTINPKRNDTIYDLEPKVFHGKVHITEILDGFKFKISPKSFFQTNSYQAEKLYKTIRSFTESHEGKIVYDLYCGTGSIGIFCSKGARKIIGVELVADAVRDAHENAILNGLENCFFEEGDVVSVCNDAFFERHGRPDVVVTDPPRAGMHDKLIAKLLEIAAPVVVYVSCNPATQARDLSLLAEKYEIEAMRPVDMFPHTLHIENVAKLVLRELREHLEEGTVGTTIKQ